MVLSLDRWKGQVAVVTGASSGIGAALATRLVKEGLKVVGLARRVERVQELAKKLKGEKGELHAVKADITKEEDVIKAFKWIKDNLGSVHILVNNAGYFPNSNLTSGETKVWKAAFDLNVLGLSIATREAVKNMRENKIDGHIIHINSVLGHRVINIPGLNVYAASKFAVTALTETLRQELNQIGSKIKISSVSPGLVETEMTTLNNDVSEDRKKLLSQLPILKPDDIVDGVVYVLSTPPHVQVHELTIQPLGAH